MALSIALHGSAVGAYGLLYAAVLFVLGRRVTRIWRREVQEGALWKDLAGMALANILLAIIFLG